MVPSMSLPAPLHRYDHADYLALEQQSPVRHEFVGGEIYAMAGGTPGHAALAAMVLRIVGNQLEDGCRAYTSDLRVRIASSDVTTYPDGAVVVGKIARAADDSLAMTNPVLLIEVTSGSTESYDRGVKLDQYKLLSSVREVLIVSHRKALLQVHRRGDDGAWAVVEAGPGSKVELASVGAILRVDEVYRDGLDDA